MDLRAAFRRPLTWVVVAVGAVLLIVVVAPFVYINLIRDDAPDRLTFDDASPSATAGDGDSDEDEAAPTSAAGDETPAASASADATDAAGAAEDDLDGTWTVADGSQAGYRVKEVLFGQDTEGVGRTSEITGSLVVEGTTVPEASFEVDMTTVTSDESRRDGQFNGRIMETDQFPTATFVLTEPIELEAIPPDLEEVTVTATGELTLHGVTNPVTFELNARRNGDAIEVNGSVPITFADYDIDNPSGGPASVGDEGEMEFLLVFRPDA